MFCLIGEEGGDWTVLGTMCIWLLHFGVWMSLDLFVVSIYDRYAIGTICSCIAAGNASSGIVSTCNCQTGASLDLVYRPPYSGRLLMTPSNATSAIALAGNALKKHGTNPLQYPLHPFSLHTVLAASLHRGNRLPSPSGSVIMRCLTTSLG